MENFTRDKSECFGNELGENSLVNKLIIMDDVSGLADKSQEFSNFLTVSENTVFLACTYFIQYIQVDKTGK